MVLPKAINIYQKKHCKTKILANLRSEPEARKKVFFFTKKKYIVTFTSNLETFYISKFSSVIGLANAINR